MRQLKPIDPPHPALALPNHVAYKSTDKEIYARCRREREAKEQEAARAAAASSASACAVMSHAPVAFLPIYPPLAPPLPRVLSKEEQASVAVAYSKEHGVTIVQALKTLGFAT